MATITQNKTFVGKMDIILENYILFNNISGFILFFIFMGV